MLHKSFLLKETKLNHFISKTSIVLVFPQNVLRMNKVRILNQTESLGPYKDTSFLAIK